MCGKRLKRFSVLLGLLLLSLSAPLLSYSYADVTLTDTEAQELMNEIQLSKKDLNDVKNQLETAETQLSDVKNTCEEQKKSYEMQLSEVTEENENLKTAVTVTATTSVVLLLMTVLLIFF